MPDWLDKIIPRVLEPWTSGCCTLSADLAIDDDECEVSASQLRAGLGLDPHDCDHDLDEDRSTSMEDHTCPGSPKAPTSPRGRPGLLAGHSWVPPHRKRPSQVSTQRGIVLPREEEDDYDDEGRIAFGAGLPPLDQGECEAAQEPTRNDLEQPPSSGTEGIDADEDELDDLSLSTSMQTPWSDETLEEFLTTTLVEGSGLLVMKRNLEGRDTKLRERIVTYDPHRMKLVWTSTGVLRSSGGIYAKHVRDVLCEGKVVTIVSSDVVSDGANGRRNSFRGSGGPELRWKRKVLEATTERDAQILREILLLIRRQAGESNPTSPTSSMSATSSAVVSTGRGRMGVGQGIVTPFKRGMKDILARRRSSGRGQKDFG